MNTTNAGWHVSQYRKTRLLYRDVQMSMSVGILLSEGHAGEEQTFWEGLMVTT